MAKRVEGVTEKLLESAKKEFLKSGYENASLQVIAENALILYLCLPSFSFYCRRQDNEPSRMNQSTHSKASPRIFFKNRLPSGIIKPSHSLDMLDSLILGHIMNNHFK